MKHTSKHYLALAASGLQGAVMRLRAVLCAVLFGLQMQGNFTALANTYDAAMTTTGDTVRRTNDAPVTARHLLWKKGATAKGAALCGATDTPLGTIDNLETGTGVGMTINLLGRGRSKTCVAAVAIAQGDRVYTADAGKVTNVPVIGCSYIGQANTATANNNDLVDVIDCAPVKLAGSHEVIAAGIHVWAGGAATADSIAVAGLLETDVVVATLTARASTETLVMAANDAGNDQIDLTLGANGTNGTTKINYAVLRPIA